MPSSAAGQIWGRGRGSNHTSIRAYLPVIHPRGRSVVAKKKGEKKPKKKNSQVLWGRTWTGCGHGTRPRTTFGGEKKRVVTVRASCTRRSKTAPVESREEAAMSLRRERHTAWQRTIGQPRDPQLCRRRTGPPSIQSLAHTTALLHPIRPSGGTLHHAQTRDALPPSG